MASAQGPHSHIGLLTGGGGGVQGIFLGCEKKCMDFFGYCTFHQSKSTITYKVQFTVGVGFFLVC